MKTNSSVNGLNSPFLRPAYIMMCTLTHKIKRNSHRCCMRLAQYQAVQLFSMPLLFRIVRKALFWNSAKEGTLLEFKVGVSVIIKNHRPAACVERPSTSEKLGISGQNMHCT